MKKLKIFWKLIKDSFKELKDNDPLRLAAATAFMATFSLTPSIVLLVNLLGLILDEEMVTGQLFSALEDMVGQDTAEQIQNVLVNIEDLRAETALTIAVFIFLMFVASTLFIVVLNSFNQIWKIKPKRKRMLKFVLKSRGVALAIILLTGILFLLALLSDFLMAFLGDNLFEVLPTTGVWALRILNQVISLGIFTVWFAIVYKFLPDMAIPWKPVWVGAFLAAVLFSIGQFILGQVLVDSQVNDIYGASGSLALLLLFIFYCSFIIYFGISFIKNYTQYFGYEAHPKKFTVKYEIRELPE